MTASTDVPVASIAAVLGERTLGAAPASASSPAPAPVPVLVNVNVNVNVNLPA